MFKNTVTGLKTWVLGACEWNTLERFEAQKDGTKSVY